MLLSERLARAHRLEKAARKEVDRLMVLAWEAGATNGQIAALVDMTPDAIRMRRRRMHVRGDKRRGHHFS